MNNDNNKDIKRDNFVRITKLVIMLAIKQLIHSCSRVNCKINQSNC